MLVGGVICFLRVLCLIETQPYIVASLSSNIFITKKCDKI